MRKLLAAALCALTPLAAVADREIPYDRLHATFARVAAATNGKYCKVDAVLKSNDPAVPTKDIRLVIRARDGDIAVPVAGDGRTQFPLRDDLLQENPPVVTNVAKGKLQFDVSLHVLAPPAQRFRYELMAAMEQEYDALIAGQGLMARMLAPDLDVLVISYAPGTAASATVEAAPPATLQADADGRIRIPDRKSWRKQNPFVQLSAMPLNIELDRAD